MLGSAYNLYSKRTRPLISDPTPPSGAADAAPAKKPARKRTKAPAIAPTETQLQLVLRTLDDDKAADIVTIDLTGKSALADTMIVASGRSQRHVSAVADHLLRALKEGGHGSARVEGLPHSDWVLIDTGDVIVHLFRPEVRVFYNLEKLWLAVANAEGPAPGSA